jgi:outer membrane protein, heavy metal efflux system
VTEAVAKARAEARRAFAAALAAQRRVEIASDVAQLGEGLARAARIRLEQGAGSQLDLLQASLAQHRRAQEVIDRRAELEVSRAALAATLGGTPADFGALVAPGALGSGLPAMEQLQARAAHHPRLLVLDAEREAALAADREQAAVVPAPALSLEYERLPDMAPGYGVRGGISFDLPVLSWNGGAVAGQRARARQAEAEREATRKRVMAGLSAAVSKRAAAAEKAERYERDLVPEAQRLAGMSQLAYQEGKAPLTTALQAQLDLADTRDQAAAAAQDAEVAEADLEEALGGTP